MFLGGGLGLMKDKKFRSTAAMKAQLYQEETSHFNHR